MKIQTKQWRHLHAALTVIWILLIIPTLTLWKESILWIALMSIWANIASHFAAYQATRAEEEAE